MTCVPTDAEHFSGDRFYENIYLFTESGKIIAGREHKRSKHTSFYGLIMPEDAAFINRWLESYATERYAVVLGARGDSLVLIDRSLYEGCGLLIAFSSELLPEVLCRAGRGSASFLLARCVISDSASILLEAAGNGKSVASDDAAIAALFERIGLIGGLVDGSDGLLSDTEETAGYMARSAESCATLFGCGIRILCADDLSVEVENPLAVSAYLRTVAVLLTSARSFANGRRATLELRSDRMGIYYDVTFDVFSGEDGSGLHSVADLKRVFFADPMSFLMLDGNRIICRSFPWEHVYTREELKKFLADFD